MTDNIPVGATCGQPIFLVQPRKNEFSICPECGKFERVPNQDTYCTCDMDMLFGNPAIKGFKMPSSKQITKAIALIPVVLESGKRALIAIFDIRDTWETRKHPSDQQLKAVVLPDNVANVFLDSANMAEA